ncbi:hypothetical protein ACGE0T_14345 [Parabacteroides sp. APC149_11_2_Y6]
MIYKNYNPVRIRKALMDEVKRLGLSKNIFSQNRPKTYEQMNDFVVCKVSTGVRDQNAYGDTSCRIELYVKSLQNGLENENKMGKMTDKLEGFKAYESPYHFFVDSIIPMGIDGYGFSMSAVIISTVIERVN